MDLAGPASTLSITHNQDSLLFEAIPRRRWIDLLVPLLLTACLRFWVANSSIAVQIFVVAVTFVLWLIYWLNRSSQTLFVSAHELVSSQAGSVPWHSITEISYGQGGEDDPSGLYSKGINTSRCLLQISEEQTAEVLNAIYSRFPYPPFYDYPPDVTTLGLFGGLFGSRSALTTLNLSRPEGPKA